MVLLKIYSQMKGSTITNWLNISISTVRRYRKPTSNIKILTKVKLIQLLNLYRHGDEMFGNSENFNNRLLRKNISFDLKSPASFLRAPLKTSLKNYISPCRPEVLEGEYSRNSKNTLRVFSVTGF